MTPQPNKERGIVITKGTGISLGLLISCVVLSVAVAMAYSRLSFQICELTRHVKMMTIDRWTKTDDLYFMEDFARTNGLEMPIHKRVSTIVDIQIGD